jgi:hypothetical protein
VCGTWLHISSGSDSRIPLSGSASTHECREGTLINNSLVPQAAKRRDGTPNTHKNSDKYRFKSETSRILETDECDRPSDFVNEVVIKD